MSESDCASCRLLLPGHPCGHWWMNGERREPVRWWQRKRRREQQLYMRACIYTEPRR